MRRANYWLSLGMIFVMPWMDMVHIPGTGTLSRLLGFAASAFWLLTVVRAGRMRKPTLFHLLAIAFLLWNAATVLWSRDVDRTWDRMFIYVRMVGMALMIWDLYDSPAMIRGALQVYVLGACIHAGSVFYNFWLGVESVYGRFAAAGNIANTTAYVLGMGIPLAWYLAGFKSEAKKGGGLGPINLVYIPIALLAIAFSATRFGILMALPAFLYGLVLLIRSQGFSAILILVVVAALSLPFFAFVPAANYARLAEIDDSIKAGDLTGRVDLWKMAAAAWETNPLLGIGSDAFPSVNRSGKAVHNSYLVILTETGVVGLALYLLLLLCVFLTIWRLPGWNSLFWLTVFVVWGTASTVLNIGHDKSIWLFFSLIMANARIAQTEENLETRSAQTPQVAITRGAPVPVFAAKYATT